MRIDVSDEIAEHILCAHLSELYFGLKKDRPNDIQSVRMCFCIEQILAWYGEEPWEEYKPITEIK